MRGGGDDATAVVIVGRPPTLGSNGWRGARGA